MAGYAAYIAAHGSAVLLADGTAARAVKEEREDASGSAAAAAVMRFHFAPAVEGRIGEGDILTNRSRALRVRRLEFVEDGDEVLTIVAVCGPLD